MFARSDPLSNRGWTAQGSHILQLLVQSSALSVQHTYRSVLFEQPEVCSRAALIFLNCDAFDNEGCWAQTVRTEEVLEMF